MRSREAEREETVVGKEQNKQDKKTLFRAH